MHLSRGSIQSRSVGRSVRSGVIKYLRYVPQSSIIKDEVQIFMRLDHARGGNAGMRYANTQVRPVGLPGNSVAIQSFRKQVCRAWLRALRRRSQKGKRLSWEKFNRHIQPLLPVARILHPYPNVRFFANHLRQEPCASIAHARICAGGAG